MNAKKIVEMNQGLPKDPKLYTKGKIKLPKGYECFRPVEKPTPLVAFDIVDKLRDLEAETACQILDELISRFPDVQEFLVENYIDLLIEEEY